MNHECRPFLAMEVAEIWSTGQKMQSFLNTYLNSVYTRYEVDRVIRIPDNGRKPPIVAIFRHQRVVNVANATKKDKILFLPTRLMFPLNFMKFNWSLETHEFHSITWFIWLTRHQQILEGMILTFWFGFFFLHHFHPMFSDIQPTDEVRHGQQNHQPQHCDLGQDQSTLQSAEPKVICPLATEDMGFILVVDHILASFA